MILEEGKIVWTCHPTIEAGYYDRLDRPRQVKLRLDKVWYAHGFNYQSGEIDTDMNATIFATPHNCFKTLKEANDFYENYLLSEVQAAQEELDNFRKTRDSVCE